MVFFIWHSLITLGAFILVYGISFVQWRWAKWRENQVESKAKQAKVQERPIRLHQSLQRLGAVMVLYSVVGLMTRIGELWN